MNRYKNMLGIWMCLLSWCIFVSASIYVNGIVIAFAFVGSMVWFGHIEKSMNESELRTFNTLRNIF